MRPRLLHCLALGLSGIWLGSIRAPGADLRISSDFPGGSAKVLGLDQTNNTIRIMPAGDPRRGWPCWWYFRLDGAPTNQPVVLEVVANEGVVQTEKPGETRTLPATWSLPEQAAYSTDGTNWQHTQKGGRQGNHTVYYINTAAPTLWLAWGPPFTLRDANQLIHNVCARSPDAAGFVLAQTRGGRPVPGVRIASSGTGAGPRFTVWIQARQHAWECGSSWVARGFAEWLVSDDPAAQSLRRKADIVIIPIIDVDSVELGQGGKNALPQDQDLDWSPAPYFPEVRADQEKLSALAKADRLDLFLDLHNPSFSARVIDFYLPPVPLLLPRRVANQNRFFKIVQAQMTGPFRYTGKIGPNNNTYDPAVNRSADGWVAAHSPPHTVSLTMEIPWNTPGGTPSGYLKTGGQLGRCIDLYLQPVIRSDSASGAR